MDPISKVSGRAIPFGAKNVDTDIIIPAKWLKTITREGLGAGAFESVREQDGNVFDDPAYQGAPILLAGDNFGCGSSREHAAWAILDLGIRAVIAPSFSDIFSGNAVKNGILPIVLEQAAIDRLLEVARDGHEIDVDLDTQSVTTPFQDRFTFNIDPFRKHCLLNGLDEVALTLERQNQITEFEANRSASHSWIGGGTNI